MPSVPNLVHTLNPFRHQSIIQKITMTTVGLFLGFGVIGATYYTLYRSGEHAEVQRLHLEKLVETSDQVEIKVLIGQNLLKEFLLTNNETLVKSFEANLQEAKKQVEALQTLAQDTEYKQRVSQLSEVIAAYQRQALQEVDIERKIGLDENSGLHGAIRQAASLFEAELKQHNLPALHIAFLAMRRHEKDYLQRKTDTYIEKMTQERASFQNVLQAAKLSEATVAQVGQLGTAYYQAFLSIVEAVKESQKITAAADQQEAQVEALVTTLNKEVLQAENVFQDQRVTTAKRLNTLFAATLLIVAVLVVASLTLLARGMRGSLRQLRAVVAQVAAGNLEARVRLTTADELGQLGNAFDQMLDERVASIVRTEKENAQLNQSVSVLLDATAQLADRDLTVRVPVTEDITGNIGDALNMMTTEMSSVLGTVNTLAAQLESAAGNVRDQGGRVASTAANERQVLAQALERLAESTRTMAEVAKLALSSNELAANTGESTRRALNAVRNTTRSMNDIRNGVSETEKGIKRLGERSQEIGSIVEIIKDIAGRTHTLALNAGMQAVAAGEAGRGFSIVADEVQRLSETARESTDQIASLVHSIQAEASETMATMNKTIDQVVQGSELAETAVKRMRRTQTTTNELVAAVAQIADRSQAQVVLIDALRGQAVDLQESTLATEQELQAQTAETEEMFHHLEELVQSVRVFKLPDVA